MPDIFRRMHHVCIVVHDIAKAQAFYESVGIGPWQDYPPLDQYTELDVPSRTGFLGMVYKYADVENMQIQLCQPPEEDCPQRRFLNEKGEGVFHLGFTVPDCNLAEAKAAESGLHKLMKGRRPDGSGFTYFDTAASAGVLLEIRKAATT
ncbi:VOC family protein [Sphingosinicella rhizophila]|uniref:VOC family protein n=1 Tax=Sphingosinicella rhizophila TaxID=3050082 RepID=A0ABU3Q5T4_9SPHN|nr:VOC family protein [Sphingosinicella sp. GR2756]MDT9598771.1 VOC family protein [Sphingosinicella sp. GR2756]